MTKIFKEYFVADKNTMQLIEHCDSKEHAEARLEYHKTESTGDYYDFCIMTQEIEVDEDEVIDVFVSRMQKDSLKDRVKEALDIIYRFGGIDGEHHKKWCLDQILQVLLKDDYDRFIDMYCSGEDGPNTYEWSQGIEP